MKRQARPSKKFPKIIKESLSTLTMSLKIRIIAD
jgi:hypothetical protein